MAVLMFGAPFGLIVFWVCIGFLFGTVVTFTLCMPIIEETLRRRHERSESRARQDYERRGWL